MASNDDNKYPQHPYYFQPPTWPDPYPSSPSMSSTSSSVPKWVIAAIVVAVAILIFFLVLYIRKREKKIRKTCTTVTVIDPTKIVADPTKTQGITKPPSDSGSTTEVIKSNLQSTTNTAVIKTQVKSQNKIEQKTKPHPTPQEQIYIPNTCPDCGKAGGVYSFNYLCPWCKYNIDNSFSYPGPSEKK